MRGTRRRKAGGVLLGLALGLAPSAWGAPIEPGVEYALRDHPDGNQRPPGYGLRLDGLFDLDSSREWTFSFDAEGADMRLSWDGAGELRIGGTAFGGEDTGDTWSDPQLWQVEFTYTGVVASEDALHVPNAEPPLGGGFLKPAGGKAIPLVDFNGDPAAPTFHLAAGHRGLAGLSGWGWLNHSGEPHVYASDWLFAVGAPVPEPRPLGLLAVAAAALVAGRYRGRSAAR